MTIGIDRLTFYIPPVALNMEDLATARQEDPNKYLIGLGQSQMALAPAQYDIVSLAVNAAKQLNLSQQEKESIGMVLFASESGIDYSKNAALWLLEPLGLPSHVRTLEIKQACYGATAALRLAQAWLAAHPNEQVLVIASDIANYPLASPGEPTQGAGAVALLVTHQPRLITLEDKSGVVSQEISDFWRPTGCSYPLVDGKYSNEAYLEMLLQSWRAYDAIYPHQVSDYDHLLFHVPYTKMGLKALDQLEAANWMTEQQKNQFLEKYQAAIIYNRQVGNIYTGSLYLSLISLLEQSTALKAGDRIGLYSYGSGAVGEFFVGVVQEDFEQVLLTATHSELLAERTLLSIDEYEELMRTNQISAKQLDIELPDTYTRPGDYVLHSIQAGERFYQWAKVGKNS